MPDTTNRPTPEEIAEFAENNDDVLEVLGLYGYVIVHPDDVPTQFLAPEGLFGSTYEEAYEFGCRRMRSHIFGGDQ